MSVDHTAYIPLINRIIKKYDKRYWDDLYQECFIVLLGIANKWTQTEESFIRYAARTLKYTCIDFFNKNRLNNVSLDMEYQDAEGEHWSPVDYLEEPTDLDSHLEAKDYLDRVSNPNEDKVEINNLYYNHGYTCAEIAEFFPHLGAPSESSVQRIINQQVA